MRPVVTLLFILLLSLLVVGCSEEDSGEDSDSPGTTRGPTGNTLASAGPSGTTRGDRPPNVGGGERSGDVPEGAPRPRPDAVLRIEGGENTTFSGICAVGQRENVIGGEVPKRYAFDLDGQQLSCRIQKRDDGAGNLRVVLLAGDRTRSVQQTTTRDNIIRLVYGDV